MMDAEEFARRQATLRRDALARRRLAAHATPGLPVDGDPPELRNRVARAGDALDALLDEMLVEKNPFFDALVDEWPTLAPDFPARPGRAEGDRIFLYVRTSGQLFALRGKLPALKRKLLARPGAPRKLSLHLEIHAH